MGTLCMLESAPKVIARQRKSEGTGLVVLVKE